jgi:NADPH2:quinone reductase
MPTTARVARIHEYGPPEVLRFEDIVVGEPGDDEALIRNTVIGLNFVDVYYRRGSLPVPAFPAISVGDRVVYGDIAFGAYATARLYPADRLVRIPAGVSDDQAASAFLKGLTARCLLKEVLELRPGDTVLYHAAAGGVGQIFVQWAKALDLKVIGTVSSDAKAKLARHAGCDHVINYSSEDFVAEALAFTAGKGVAAVFDSVGADTFRGSLAVLRPRGTLVQFGNASGFPEPVDPFELAPRALYLTWPILPHYTSTAEDLAVAAADLFDAIATGILKVDPSNLYPFGQLIEAHHDLEERRTTGAAVLRVTAAGSHLIKFHALQRPKTPAAPIHETILN